VTLNISGISRKFLERIEETTSVREAARKMREKNVSSLLVVDTSGIPVGLVTERDIVRKFCINDVSTRTMTSKDIMSSPLITISVSSSISTAADMMLKNNVRHLLIVDDGHKPIGIITPLDFVRHQKHIAEEDREAIERVLERYMSSPDSDLLNDGSSPDSDLLTGV
jgi:signal-transduction protein with cAMP-binding, CBS, and nucleotidyltransferase domain